MNRIARLTAILIHLQTKRVFHHPHRTTLKALSQYYGVVAPQLAQEAKRLNLEVNGPVQWVYTSATGAYAQNHMQTLYIFRMFIADY